jgi:hypothetical protein
MIVSGLIEGDVVKQAVSPRNRHKERDATV